MKKREASMIKGLLRTNSQPFVSFLLELVREREKRAKRRNQARKGRKRTNKGSKEKVGSIALEIGFYW